MNICRSVFLTLTAGMASAACAVQISAGTGSRSPQNTPQPPAPAAPSPQGPAVATPEPGPVPTPGPTGPVRKISRADLAATRASKAPDPAPSPAPSPAPAPAPACLDDGAATVAECAVSSPASEGCGTFASQKCASYKMYLKPKVAAKAVSCMNALPKEQTCGSTAPYDCGRDALKSACADAHVAEVCKTVATACKETAESCSQLVSGLNDAGKQAVAACAARGCSAGLYSCIEGLMPSTEGGTGSRLR